MRFDAGQLAFIDSSGLHAILTARTSLLAHGIEFELDPLSLNVRRVFDVAGTTDELLANQPPTAHQDNPRSTATDGVRPTARQVRHASRAGSIQA